MKYERIGDPRLRAFRVRLPPPLLNGLMDDIIDLAEGHARYLPGGWRTDLYSLTKCDMACRDVPGMPAQVKPVFDYICYAMEVLYGCRKVVVDKNQPHILKYEAASGHTGGKRDWGILISTTWNRLILVGILYVSSTIHSLHIRQHLPLSSAVELHHDRCDVTANLALSKSTDYGGGGTILADTGSVVRLEQGEFLLHPGSLVHGGMDITYGTRYLLVTFAHFK
jgi:hypothetical protein